MVPELHRELTDSELALLPPGIASGWTAGILAPSRAYVFVVGNTDEERALVIRIEAYAEIVQQAERQDDDDSLPVMSSDEIPVYHGEIQAGEHRAIMAGLKKRSERTITRRGAYTQYDNTLGETHGVAFIPDEQLVAALLA